MAESIGVDIGTRILQAVEGLGLRMDRLEARMDGLEARMGKLEARMDGLEARMGKLEARMDGLEAQVTDLGRRMDKVESEVKDLRSRMERQEKLMEMLGAEFIKWRDTLRGDILQLRTEMNDGFRRLNARLDLTDSVVVLLAGELRRPMEFSKELETNLRELEAR
jgi:chromosome segregation ATPase